MIRLIKGAKKWLKEEKKLKRKRKLKKLRKKEEDSLVFFFLRNNASHGDCVRSVFFILVLLDQLQFRPSPQLFPQVLGFVFPGSF